MQSRESDLQAQRQALVVYESMFGSTRAIARAIAEGLRDDMTVTLCEVSTAPTTLPPDLDLLVVAAPTHAFGLSRPATRAAAAEQALAPLVSQRQGVREWLAELAPAIECAAAAVDTRAGPRHLPGSAARGIVTRLRHLGFTVVLPAQSFWVPKAQGELLQGEQDRARRWGAELASEVTRRHSTPRV